MSKENVVDLFLDLVAINSPSGEESEIRSWLLAYLDKKGIRTSVDARGNLIAYISEDPSKESTLFAAHIDTVPNAVNARVVREGGTIRTDGTTALGADDKSAVAAMLVAIDEVQKASTPAVYLFSVSEETGLDGVKELDTSLLPPIGSAYILDAQQALGRVMTFSPSHYKATITFTGVAAHAGFAPEKGVNAISLAARALDQMKLLRIDERTTANIGTIHGGQATNIVAPSCEVTVEVRAESNEKCLAHFAHMEMCCIKAVGALGGSYEMEHKFIYPAYQIDEKSKALEKFRSVCESLSLPFEGVPTGGGADTNILREMGYDALTLASGYSNAHSVTETIEESALHTLVQLVEALARQES